MTIQSFSDRANDLVSDPATQTSASQHVSPSQRSTRALAAQRNKLTGDRRAGTSPPAGVRLSDGLACTLSTMAMCVHVSAQQRVHAGFIAAPLATKPIDNVGVDAKRK